MGALVKKEVQAAVANPEQGQYLTFLLGGEIFAIGILGIKEIIEYGSLTTVPMMPEFIRGVINLRGAVEPVVDLSAWWWTRSPRCWKSRPPRSSRLPASVSRSALTSSAAWAR